jgi:DNA modification methylase
LADWQNRIVGQGEESPEELIKRANPNNPRLHPEGQRVALENILDTVGVVSEVIVNKRTGHIIDGHLRIELALSKGEASIPVKYVDLTPDEEKLVIATFDPIAGLAEFDPEILEGLKVDIETAFDFDLGSVFSDLGSILDSANGHETERDVEPQIDKAAELRQEYGTELGQLWELGRHRLAVGDCTDKVVVNSVLQGDIPLLMVTDPPYGVNYDPNWRNEAAEKGFLSYSARRTGTVLNDDRVDWSDAYLLFPGDVAYTWSPGGEPVILTGVAMQKAGFQIRNQIMWRKPHFPISRGHYTYQHEPCWYGVRKGKKSHWIGDNTASTVWEISLDKNVDGGHSTQKPLECMARPIHNHEGDVYDPFLGSGTTLIACENLGRRCRGIEIDPGYAAVSIHRWEQQTGKKAQLVSETKVTEVTI